MTLDQLFKHYGTQVAVADALGVSQPCVSNWVKRGRIPPMQQLKVQMLTDGKLKADKNVFKGAKLSPL
jgi:predicted transcriptional regulator